MSERISKLILETEFRTTGDIAPDVQKIEQLRKGVQSATGDTLKLIEAEKKLEQASIQAGVAVENQSKKQSDFNKTVQQGSKALTDLGQTNKLKEAFAGGAEIKNLTELIEDFKNAASSAKSVDELRIAMDKLIDSLPTEIQGEVIQALEKDFQKLADQIENPVKRLKVLKDLINQETDPKVLDKLLQEAAQIQNELGDTKNLLKELSSNTFFTDTLVEGATTAVSAFTAFQGALSLVTDDQEELAKAAQKAQGALALLQGTQTLLNELKKSDNIITRSQIVLQRAYTAVVGESVGVTKGLRVALASLGVGLLVAGVIALISNWEKWFGVVKKTNFEQERTKRIQDAVIDGVSKEAAALEIARAKINDTNTSQKDRIQIVRDLQQQYPGYLKNINAETASNEELNAAINKVNEGLIVKYRIQATEQELVNLFTTRNALEAQYQKQLAGSKIQLQEISKLQDINPDIKKQIEELTQASTGSFTDVTKQVIDETDALIQSLLDSIVKDSNQLSLLGGNEKGGVKEKDKALIEGTIAYYEAKASALSKKVREELAIGSNAFVDTLDLFFEAKKKADEAAALLNKDTAIIFTEGSLNALNKQASEIKDIINNLPDGAELRAKVEELNAVEAKIKELQDIINGGGKVDDLKKVNFDLLNEEERHQLAMLQIEERGEQARLKTQLTYAKERLKILQESGTATEAELEQAKNAVTELEAELNKSQANFNKEFVNKVVDGFKLIVTEAFNATQQILALKQEEVDGLRRLQEQRVEDARAIADKGNAAVLKAEEERLAKLDEQSRKYARQQIALTQLQITAQSALAIAKAAAEGGVAAPFTIAATLIALAVGYAQARAQASQIGTQSFKKGGYFDGGFTGNGNPNEVSTAQGYRPYEYHKGEYIHNAQVTAIGKNREWFEQIRLKRLDLDKLFHRQNPVVIVNNDSSKVVEAIQRIPATRLSVDKNGVFRIVESTMNTERKRQSIKRRGK